MLREMSLLDTMAIQAGCMYLSDLRRMNPLQREQLALALERVTARDEDLFDWDDALTYLTGENPPCFSAEQAKAALIAALSSPRHGR